MPTLVHNEYFGRHPRKVKFMLPNGTTEVWKLFYNNRARRNECHIGKGWYEFASREDLKKDDKLIFSSDRKYIFG